MFKVNYLNLQNVGHGCKIIHIYFKSIEKKKKKKGNEKIFTWVKWDGFVIVVVVEVVVAVVAATGRIAEGDESFIVDDAGGIEGPDVNCETRTERDRVTDLANFANFDRPPFGSSVSIGCFKAVISRKVNKNNTTRSLSFFIGAI